MDKATFRTMFGGVYEHSPWLADEVFDAGGNAMLGDADALCAGFEAVFLSSGRERQLAVLQAHPQLACALAGQTVLTADSRHEQRGAGLDECSESELKQFIDMNEKYMNKNNFPFILAVKGLNRREILKAFRERLDNDTSSEFRTALAQVCQIANFRIREILHDRMC